MKPRLAWVTGAGGLIGNCIVRLAPEFAPSWTVIGLTRADLDLTDVKACRRRWELDRPSLMIHCAALSRSPACEADPVLARRLNTEVTAQLAELAAGEVMIFFSSDLVFDGAKGGYTEDDTPRPLSVYSRTKVDAEKEVLRRPENLVVRTSLNYGQSPSGDRSFNEEMLMAAKDGRVLRLFTDEFRCPIGAEVTARALWELAEAALRGAGAGCPSGILHLCGAERLSRWAIGQLLTAVHPQLRGHIEPGSLREYSGAPRPPDTSLNCAKVQRFLNFSLPGFSEWLGARYGRTQFTDGE